MSWEPAFCRIKDFYFSLFLKAYVSIYIYKLSLCLHLKLASLPLLKHARMCVCVCVHTCACMSMCTCLPAYVYMHSESFLTPSTYVFLLILMSVFGNIPRFIHFF